MTLINFLLYSLAVWRIAFLFAYEHGPLDILARFRYLVGVRYDEASKPKGKNWFAKGLICVKCSSLWWAALLVYFVAPDLQAFIIYTLAISAGAILFNKVTDG